MMDLGNVETELLAVERLLEAMSLLFAEMDTKNCDYVIDPLRGIVDTALEKLIAVRQMMGAPPSQPKGASEGAA